jgi:hypothetical protein
MRGFNRQCEFVPALADGAQNGGASVLWFVMRALTCAWPAGRRSLAALAGILLMLFLQRSEALWPIVLGHYLADVVDFA